MMFSTILLALRYMSRRKIRTLLTTLAILFGVMVIYGSGLLAPSIRDAMAQQMLQPGTSALRIEKISGEVFLPDTILQVVGEMEGVRALTGILRLSYAMPVPNVPERERPVIEVIGVDPNTALAVSVYPISEGRFLQSDDTRHAVIPNDLAEMFGVSAGDSLPLLLGGRLQIFTVVGLLDNRGLPKLQVILPLAEVQTAFELEGHVNTLDIAIESGADHEAVTAQVLATLGTDFRVNETFDLEAYTQTIELGTGIMNVFGSMALFVGGFLIFNTFRTAATERQTDLSLLRAIGAERGQIIRLILTEGFIQGVVGTILGLAVGFVFAQWVLQWTVANDLLPMIDTVPADAFQLKFDLSLAFSVSLVGVGTTLFAGYLPAYRAGHVSPLAALRPMLQSQQERAARLGMIAGILSLIVAAFLLVGGNQTILLGGFLTLVGAALLAPALIVPAMRLCTPFVVRVFPQAGEIARGNILRQPGRAAVTVNTVMIGFAIFIVSATLVASTRDYAIRLFTGSFVSDVILSPTDNILLISNGEVKPSSIIAPQLVEQLRDNPSVAALTGIRLGTTAYDGQPFTLLGIEPQAAAELRPIYFRQGEGDFNGAMQALDAGRALVVTRFTAQTLGLALGDTLELNTPLSGTQVYTVAGIADDLYLPTQASGALISQANLAQDFGSMGDITLYINLQSGATMDTLTPLLSDYPQLALLDTAQYREEAIKGALDLASMFYILALMVVLPALMGLVNTLTINVMERTREFGTIRAIGGDQGQVQRVVIAEALILGSLSAVMGILVGLVLSFGFVVLWGNQSAGAGGLYVIFPAAGIVAALVGGLMLTLLASVLPARHAARLDIIQALRYE